MQNPGQTAVKKFQDRKKAVARVWSAIQPLAGNGKSEKPAVRKPESPRKGGKPAKKAKAAKKASGKATGDKASDRSNKKAEVIAMMKRAKGATLAEIMEATGWQKHTVRQCPKPEWNSPDPRKRNRGSAVPNTNPPSCRRAELLTCA
jgi:hypothetical protein